MLIALLISWLVAGGMAHILHLDPGSVKGFEYTTKKGDVAEVFLNIPYAAPPIGKQRFEKPSPPIPWGTTYDGTKFGPSCHPHTRRATLQPPPSEDCLTLNIIRPKKKAPKEGFPILIWVHGGGYEIGSASIYGYKGFADIYIPNDIIVVTIQYRIGIYGFFSTGDSRIPGNLGLFDMAAAVKFVHSNARNIGGDGSRITAWGLSAGGSAVGQLALSPITRDYIARSIEMSGSPWAAWAMGPTVANNSMQLALILECEDQDLKSCMKSKTVDEIYEAVEKEGYTKHGLNSIKWGPVIDGEFLQNPDEMAATAPPKSAIVGVSNKDASFFTIMARSPFLHKFGVEMKDFQKWDRRKLVDFLKETIQDYFYKDKALEAVDELIEYYVDRDEEDDDYAFYLERYTQFISDLLFNVPAVDGILARRQAGWKMYAYSFDHYNEAIWNKDVPKRLRGSPHINEYPYMFDVFMLGAFEIDEKERVVADLVEQSFISFVKNGVPKNEHIKWKDVGKKETIRYLSISPEPHVRNGFYKDAAKFWHKMREYGFDVVQMLPTSKNVSKETSRKLFPLHPPG